MNPGTQVAGYLIEERLGVGGMAVVYRAVDQRLGRRVALKILSPELAADAAFRQRFIRESRAAAAVDDPHIIPVFEAGDADDVLFIAMRYVPGGDVHSLVREAGPLPPGRAALIMSQVASALDAAHRHGLVHRDVKPANMLMDVSGGGDRPDHVYLSDFGVSKGVMSVSSLTGTGMFVGTLDYIAPEQLEGKAVSGQTDQYALACSAFELLSGAPPFPRDAAMPVIVAHLSEQPPSMTSRRPDLPARVDEVLSRALAKPPAERYATCREFTDALRAALGLSRYESGGNAIPPRVRTPTEAVVQPHPTATSPRMAAQGAVDRGLATNPASGHGARDLATAGSSGILQVQRKPRGPLLVIAGACVVAAALAVAAWAVLSAPGGAVGRIGGTAGAAGTRGTPTHGSSQSGTPSASQPSASTSAPSASTFTLLHSLNPAGSAKGVNALAFSSLGSLATAGDSGLVHVWDPVTGSQLATLPAAGRVYALAFSSDGKTLAAGDASGRVSLWDPTSRALLWTFTDPNSAPIEALAFSPDGKILAAGDGAGVTYLWNVSTRKRVAALPDPNSMGVNTLAFSRDGARLAAGDYNGTTFLWQWATAAQVNAFRVPSAHGDVLGVAFSPDGSILATGSYDGSTYLWDVATGNMITTLPDGNAHAAVEALAFNPDGRTLVTGDISGSTYVWQLSDYRQIQVLPSAGVVWAVGFSGNGALLAIADHRGATYLWKAG